LDLVVISHSGTHKKSPHPKNEGILKSTHSPISTEVYIAEAGVLTFHHDFIGGITAGGTVPDSHRSCLPIKFFTFIVKNASKSRIQLDDILTEFQ